MRRSILVGVSAIAAAVLACTSPLAVSTAQPIATTVAQTLAAMATSAPASAATETLAPLSTPTVSSVLPHSLYFINQDGAGLSQIFRLDADGRTLRQITFEPVSVDTYGVSPADGNVAYTTNNQLYLVDSAGAGRRLLIDGGPVDDNNRWTNSVGSPVWSRDGKTIALSYGGLSFLDFSTGATTRVIDNQIDYTPGFPVVREVYAPNAYSPDGSRLLINIGYYEAGSYAVYLPADNALVRLERPDGGIICCYVNWIPDSTGLFITSPSIGMIESGLFYANAATGEVASVLPSTPPDGTYNFAWSAQVGTDSQLYFFFNNLPEIPASGHTPLFLVRSGSDGVTGRTKLLPDAFQNINEILWAPGASVAVVVTGQNADSYTGGQAQAVYPDGRPSVVLAANAQNLHWGP